jgi:hypothetical protein
LPLYLPIRATALYLRIRAAVSQSHLPASLPPCQSHLLPRPPLNPDEIACCPTIAYCQTRGFCHPRMYEPGVHGNPDGITYRQTVVCHPRVYEPGVHVPRLAPFTRDIKHSLMNSIKQLMNTDL